MASSLPAPLKIKDIVPFVTRAVQLEKFKPIISYWCTFARCLPFDLPLTSFQATTILWTKFCPKVYIQPAMSACLIPPV